MKKKDRRKEFSLGVREEELSWKRVFIKRGLEPGGSGIAIVGAVIVVTTCK
jgi:hypothetical protein